MGNTSSLAAGRDISYQFRAPSAGQYSFRIGTPSASVDAVLYLTDSCVAVSGVNFSAYGPPQCIAAGNRNTSLHEQVSCMPLTANQTVFVWVDETTASAAGSNLNLEVTPCLGESEPNDTPATANALSCVTTGAIRVAGDVDFYALGAPPAGSRLFVMAEAAASNNTDFDMRLTTSTKTIEYDDYNLGSAFGENAPVIAGAIATGEPTFVRMNHFDSAALAEPYVLYSAIQTGAPVLETEPNDTMATATTGALYFQGTIVDGGSDVDVYSFTATAGDVVFASLDSVLDKTDGGAVSFNYAIALVDSSNAVVQRTDDTSSNTVTTGPINNTLTSTTPIFPGEGLVYRIRTTGTYGIRVDKTSGPNTNPYLLSISVGCRDLTPTLTSVTPGSGTPSGGLSVTLAGTNFSARSVVRVGSNIAPVTLISPTQLVITTPLGSAGEVPVSVTNADGYTASLNPGYTYDDPPGLPPILTSLTPLVGPIAGGTVVTLTGTVFRRDAGVFFDVGGTVVAAAAVTVTNSGRISATTPPHAEGVASVTVVNSDDLSSTLTNSFTFEGPPVVTNVTPNAGLTTGGQAITLTGRNLRAGTTVRVGANLATAVAPAAGGLSLTALTPTSTLTGAVDVIVRTTDNQNTTVTGGYTYAFPPPTITSLNVASGYAVGGQPLTITGTGFLAAPVVTFGGTAATDVVRTSSTQITLTTPAGTPGLVDVIVTNTDTQTVTRAGGFRYVAAPALVSVTPSHGPVQGGTRITLTGTDFTRGATVRLGGVPTFAVDVTSSTTITAVTNTGAAGVTDVLVVNPDLQVTTLDGGFTYDPAPTLLSATPISGSTAGGTVVTLTGAGFLTGASVVFGTTASTTVTVVSPTELTAVTPARPVGVVSIAVRNTDNQSSQLQRAFRFVLPPALTGAAPGTGDSLGGTVVRLTGAGFSAGTTVTFGGTAASQVTFVSDTELDAVTPKHSPGVVDIQVTTDGASATLTGAFTFSRSAPALVAVAPASGSINGGTLMTLTGTGFAQGASITIGGSAATEVVVVSNVLARAVVPAHAAGQADVVFTNDDAQATTLAGGFTYVAPATNNAGTVTDGGTGSLGEDPTMMTGGEGGVSCGCSSFDGSMFSMAGFGLLMVLSRRRRRS